MIELVVIFLTILIGCIILVPYAWSWYKNSFGEHLKFIPRDLPILGHVVALQDRDWIDSTRLRQKWFDENNGIFGMLIWFRPVFRTRNLKIWEDLLSSQKYTEKGPFYQILQKVIGNGLVTSHGDLWRTRRKMITPAFHFNILGDFIPVMENRTFELIHFLKKYAENAESSFDALKILKPFSMSIICETSMGMSLSLEETSNGKYKQTYERTMNYSLRRSLNPLLKSDFIFSFTENGKKFNEAIKAIRDIVVEVIEQRLKFRQDPSSVKMTKRRIFIDIMLDAYEKGEIDIDGILNEVNTFVNAGYETTSTALSWCLYCLGRNQHVQNKLYKELNDFGKADSLIMDDLKELKFLDHVIKETLRLHPVVGRVGRTVPSGTVLGGIKFPACTVSVDICSMNRSPDVWDNPMEFRPERFEEFDEKKKSAFVYIPFSAGPRNCIGQRFAMFELKVALYHLIRAYEVTSLQNESELKETFGVTHGSQDGLILTLKCRN